MTDHTTLLIVDDEPDIQHLVKRYFDRLDFEVLCAGSGAQMQQQLAKHVIDVVLLDICLPDVSGVDLLPDIKAHHQAAVIMLTAQGSTEQRIAGLNLGADDYMPKPFDLNELHARINAVLRRSGSQADRLPECRQFKFAAYTLNSQTRTLYDRAQKTVDLSPAEYDLLLVLLKNPGIVLDRDYLMLTTRGRPASAHDRAIDVRIGQLRKKLLPEGTDTPLISTVRGGGYMLNCTVNIN